MALAFTLFTAMGGFFQRGLLFQFLLLAVAFERCQLLFGGGNLGIADGVVDRVIAAVFVQAVLIQRGGETVPSAA